MSVILPCYQHATTLPWALASLIAQTHPDWECIVVDDGSIDGPAAVVDAFGDPRVVYVRLEKNRGRSAARQVALERAQGEFIAFLDADDWVYPARLEAQLACFAGSPDLAAVGSGMAIVDGANRLLGVRGCIDDRGVGSGPWPLPRMCGRATVMLRGDVARSGRFDPGRQQGEDNDYLGRVLDRRAYQVLASPLYVYRQETLGTAARSLRAHALRRRNARTLADRFPVRARARIVESYIKTAAYGVAAALGLDRLVATSRNVAPTGAQRRDFELARDAVARVVDSV